MICYTEFIMSKRQWKRPIAVEENTPDFHWLVGILEGEGSFFPASPSQTQSSVRLEFKMVDEDVMSRVATLLGTKLSGPTKAYSQNTPQATRTWRIQIAGSKAVAIMHMIYAYMGQRRQAQIDKTLDRYYEVTGLERRT